MFYSPLSDTISDSPSDFSVPLSESPRSGPNRSIIPGTKLQWVYDSTTIKLLQGCLRKYNYKFLQGWQEQETPVALAFGQGPAHLPGDVPQVPSLWTRLRDERETHGSLGGAAW